MGFGIRGPDLIVEIQTILNIGLGLGFSVLGWFAREMWSAVKELKADLAKLREELPTHYIAKDDFRRGIDELKTMLNRLFDKIDGKQDKP